MCLAAANHMKHFGFRTATKSFYIAYHLWLLMYPHRLLCDYSGSTCVLRGMSATTHCCSIAVIKSLRDPRMLAVAALYSFLALLVYFALASRTLSRTRRGQLSMATFWMVFPFVPGCFDVMVWLCGDAAAASGLLSALGFVVAERILYVPSVGFCLLLVFALTRFVPPELEQQWVANTPASPQAKADASQRSVARRQAMVAVVVVLLLIGAYSLRCWSLDGAAAVD